MKIKNIVSLFALVSILSLTANNAFSQSDSDSEKPDRELSYWKGDNIAYAGVSLLNFKWGWAGTRSTSIPPLTLAYELGIHEYISVGPFVSFGRWNYSYPSYNSDYSYTYYSMGAKASFHFLTLLSEELDASMDDSDLDMYITLHVGPQFGVSSWKNERQANTELDNDFNFLFNPVLGIRYELNESIGIYFEAGRGSFGWGTIGIAGKM